MISALSNALKAALQRILCDQEDVRHSGAARSAESGMTRSDLLHRDLGLLCQITVRQPALRLARCFIMQAVMHGMSGISELHRRNASPVHICCASGLKAKLPFDDTAAKASAKAAAKPV
jgi:hypothetical protein